MGKPMRYEHAGVDFAANVPAAQGAAVALLREQKVDILLVTSRDMFMSEYNPLCNSQRYALSGFTGSMGDGFLLTEKGRVVTGATAPFVLFVDGRYHLQADLETKPALVQVMKGTPVQNNVDVLLAWLEGHSLTGLTVGVDGMRIGARRCRALQEMALRKGFSLKLFGAGELSTALRLPGWNIERPIQALAVNNGRSIEKNIASLRAHLPSGIDLSECCIATGTSDDAAWLLNARGFHMPRSSALLGFCFVVGDEVVLYLPNGVDRSPVDAAVEGGGRVTVVRGDSDKLRAVLGRYTQVKRILLNENTVNAWLPDFCRQQWPAAALHADFAAVTVERARKTPEEQQLMRDAFLKSSRAIARTMRAAKAGELRTEADLAGRIHDEYLGEGAVELSFSTIAGAGANGAIVHYGACSRDVTLKAGDLVLLDSGAYYAEGYATDCTRVIHASGAAVESWQREIYTVVLKAFVAGMSARFSPSTVGSELDARTRGVCKESGFDYGHGTGHGIGIHVHEGGHGVNMAASTPLVVEGAVSVEPGIYLEGKGGVRIENVVLVKKDVDTTDDLRFENLIWVGFDWDLVDVGRLTDDEKRWLAGYERECLRLGTEVTGCPLL